MDEEETTPEDYSEMATENDEGETWTLSNLMRTTKKSLLNTLPITSLTQRPRHQVMVQSRPGIDVWCPVSQSGSLLSRKSVGPVLIIF